MAGTPLGAALRSAIIGQESGGDHTVVNPDSGAIGLGQVMPSNVGPWTQQALGRAMTPEEFRQDREAQLAVIDWKLNQYVQEGLKSEGDPERALKFAAAKWYSGKGSRYNDYTPVKDWSSGTEYPSVGSYADQVAARVKNQPFGQASSPPQTVGTQMPFGGRPFSGQMITDPFTRRILEQSGADPDDPAVAARLAQAGHYVGQQPDTGVAGNLAALGLGAYGSVENTVRGVADLPLALGRAAGVTDAQIGPRERSFVERANPNFAGAGALAGVIGQFALGGGLAGKVLGKAGGMLGKLPGPISRSLSGAASFGTFEGLQPGNLDERMSRALHGAKVGGIFGLLGAPPGSSRLRAALQGSAAAPLAFGSEPVLPDIPIPGLAQQILFGAGSGFLHGGKVKIPPESKTTGKPIADGTGFGALPTSKPSQSRLPTFDPSPRRMNLRTAEGPQRGSGVKVPDVGPATVPARRGLGPRVQTEIPTRPAEGRIESVPDYRGGIQRVYPRRRWTRMQTRDERGGAEFGNDKLATLAEKGPPLDDVLVNRQRMRAEEVLGERPQVSMREAWESVFTNVVNRKPERRQKPLEPKRESDPTQSIELDIDASARGAEAVGPSKPTGRPSARELPRAEFEVVPRGAPARESSYGYVRDKLNRIQQENAVLREMEDRLETVAQQRHSGQRMSALEERQKLVNAAAEGHPQAQVKLVQSIEGAVERAVAEAGLAPTAANFHVMRQKIVGELSGERPRVLRDASPETRLYDAANKAAERYLNALRRACRGL